MPSSSMNQPVAYRAGLHLFVVVGIFAALFIGIGIAVAGKRGDWTMLAGAAGVFAVLFGVVGYLRWEIGPDGFAYRSVMTNRYIAYDQIEKGRFVTIVVNDVETRNAVFELQLKDGSTMKVSLRSFPVRAAGHLFDNFERSGIPVDEPQTGAARRMFDQIEAARASGP